MFAPWKVLMVAQCTCRTRYWMGDFPPTLKPTPSGSSSFGASRAHAYITCNSKYHSLSARCMLDTITINYLHRQGMHFSQSRNSLPLMESKGSLTCSNLPAIGPSPESDESNPHLPTFPYDEPNEFIPHPSTLFL